MASFGKKGPHSENPPLRNRKSLEIGRDWPFSDARGMGSFRNFCATLNFEPGTLNWRAERMASDFDLRTFLGCLSSWRGARTGRCSVRRFDEFHYQKSTEIPKWLSSQSVA
jgi:hypothetical protein